MHVKTVPASYSVKADEESGGWIVCGYASVFSDSSPDAYGDIVARGAFDSALEKQKGTGRPRFFYDHHTTLGKILSIEEDQTGLKVEARISDTALGRDIRTLVRDGAIEEFSFAYDLSEEKGENKPSEFGGIAITKIDTLYEVSLVGIAAMPEAVVTGTKHVELQNRDAIASLRAELDSVRSALKATDRSTMDTKAASGSTDLPLADESTSWDGPAAMKALAKWASNEDGETDYVKMAQGCFWRAESPDSQDDVKLPFAVPDGEGLKAVPAGVKAAAGAVQGSRGGVDVPESDLEGVRAKIASYYKKMGDTPPWQDDDSGSSDYGKAAEDSENVEGTQGDSDERIAEAIEQVVKDLGDVAQMLRDRKDSSGESESSDEDTEEKAMDDFRRELAAMKSL